MTMVGLASALWTNGALADDNDNDYHHDSTAAPFDFYRDMEFSVDGFAVGTAGEEALEHSFRYLRHHGFYGAGAGANFFFCRYLGIGGEFYTENVPGPFIASTSGNLIARLPIRGTPISPYIFGGGGHSFDGVQQSFGQVGGGLEVRFMRHFGVFVDARYVFAGQTDNYAVGRAGLRLSF
ncbi:MAG TPA: hypothetical protein VF988_15825 [Verrucomicrobiae bacterium]